VNKYHLAFIFSAIALLFFGIFFVRQDAITKQIAAEEAIKESLSFGTIFYLNNIATN